MTNLSAPMPATEPAEAILQVFHSSPHPLTVSQAEKLYSGPKLKKNELRQIVETQLLMQSEKGSELVDLGRAFNHINDPQ